MHSTTNTKRDVIKLAKERNVRFVRLVFADIFGVSKNVSIPASGLEAALDGQVTFDGGSIDGFVRGEELDMVLRPDPASFAIYPWSSADGGEARLLCDIAMPDGSPFEGCPRTTLSRAVESAKRVLPNLQIAPRSRVLSLRRRHADLGRRKLLRFFGQRSRRGCAQRHRRRAAEHGHRGCVRASRTRARAT